MANSFFGAIELIGGTDGALDKIDGSSLADGDGAIVIDANNDIVYFYTLNSGSGAAESSPDIISPDTNAGTKRWILVKTYPFNSYWQSAFENVTSDTTFYQEFFTSWWQDMFDNASDLDTHLGQLGVKYEHVWIPAGAMTAQVTNGAEFDDTNEASTNDVLYPVYWFSGTIAEYVQFSWIPPQTWDRGTVKAKIYWTPDTGASAADGVVWGVQGQALSDDEVIDTAWGTAQEVTDAVTAVGDLNISSATAAITLAGSPAVGDWVTFRVYRDPTDGSDDMAEDAGLIGVVLQIGHTNQVSAW